MYHLERGFIQRCSHGRFMMAGARDGADMVAVFDGRVRVVEGRRAGNGVVKFAGSRGGHPFSRAGIGCDGELGPTCLAASSSPLPGFLTLCDVPAHSSQQHRTRTYEPFTAPLPPAPRPHACARRLAPSAAPPVNGAAHPLATVLLECCGVSAH